MRSRIVEIPKPTSGAIWCSTFSRVSKAFDMSITVMGQKIDMPLFCAPTALQRLFHHDGERAFAKAAEKFGTMFGRLLPFRRLVDFQHRREISLAQLGRLGLELMLKLSQLGFIGIAGFRKPGDLVRGLDKLQHGQFGALHGSGRPSRAVRQEFIGLAAA